MKRPLLLFTAILMAGITTYLFYNYTKSLKPGAVTASIPMVSVVEAKTAIKKDTQITNEMVTITQVPKNSVQPDALTTVSDVTGKIALIDIQPNEMILSHHIQATENSRFLAYKLQPGYRAVTVTARILGDNVANLIEPGDFVDVVLSLGNKTTILVSNVHVLAVDQRMEQTGLKDTYKPYTMTTLEVKPDDALKIIDAEEKVILSENKGILTLILRSAIQSSKGE